MSKKLLIKYILMYFPAVIGAVLFSNGVVNLFSSLLLFFGGYIAIKNTLDYRLVKKNIDSIKPSNIILNNMKDNDYIDKVIVESKDRELIKPKNSEDIIGLKRTRRYSRVRKKY